MGYADAGLAYHFNSNIKVMADYVFAKRRKLDGSYYNRHQGYIALVLKGKIGDVTIYKSKDNVPNNNIFYNNSMRYNI